MIRESTLLNCLFHYGNISTLVQYKYDDKALLCFSEIVRFPFWKSPIGYPIAVTIQIIILSYPCLFLTSLFLLALGAYLFSVTVVNGIVDILKSVNADLKTSKSKVDLYKKLPKLIRVHTNGKQLSATAATI